MLCVTNMYGGAEVNYKWHEKNYLVQSANINSGRTGIIGELQKSQQKVVSILERISDGFIEIDNNYIVTFMNKEAERMMGHSRNSLVGTMICEELIPRSSSLFRKALYAMNKKTNTACEGFFPPLGKWLEAHYYPSRTGLAIFFRDITQRKEEEAALRRSKQEYKTLVENSLDTIARYDCCFRHIYVNPAIENLIGLPPSYIIGKSFAELGLPGSFYKKWERHLASVFKTGKNTVFEAELRVNGVSRYAHVQVVPEFGEDGSVDCVLAIAREITERRRMEKEFARLDRLNMVGEMAASIGHEVRNPMTTVRGFLQMLTCKKEASCYAEYFQLMIEEIDRANSIITEFLSLAKNKAIDPKPGSLNKIITAVLPLIQVDALRMGSSVETKLGDVPELMLDEKEIRQCILNFVRNGLEAMPDGGVVTISTYNDGNAVVMEIADEGRGIPVEIIDKLGTPFITTKDEGTGLGLPVCYSIAERHKANISVKTGTKGTSFYIKFAARNHGDKCETV